MNSKGNFNLLLLFLLLLLGICVSSLIGMEPRGPVFIVEPEHHVDFSNSTGTRLNCAAHGHPPPVVRWTTLDREPVTNISRIRTLTQNGSLLFHPFEAIYYRQNVHATTYQCEASNAFGTIVSRNVRIRAVVKQVYDVQVYDEYVIGGNTAVLKCHIPSFVREYVSVISWIQVTTSVNFSGVNFNSRYSVMPTGELHIRDVNIEDRTHGYRCRTWNRLTNEIRESSAEGRLVVTEARGSVQPRITDSQSVVYVKQNDLAVLPCAAQGYPIPAYSWYTKISKDQLVPVSMSDRLKLFGGSLVIRVTQISDVASYVCVVNNSVGVEKVETSLYVTVPMAAFLQPQKQVVDLGQPANFDCVVTGHPVTTVSWLKDGLPLNFDSRIRPRTRESILIEGVRREDRGMYQCHARNDIEYVQGSAELRLGDAIPEITERFSEQMVHAGNYVSLGCFASGNPPPKISWTVDDFSVSSSTTNDGRVTFSEVVQSNGDVIARLNISYSKGEDGGIYKCTARNRGGSAQHSARLNVYGPPVIRPMSKKSIIAKQTMILTCPYAGYPIESIGWEKDGINLPVNHRQTVHPNGTLVVHLVERTSDSGTYSCVVRNHHNNVARRDVEIVVMVPPLLTPISFQEDNLYEGAHARVTCGVTGGDLPIEFRWQKDSGDIPSSLSVAIRDVDEYSNILSISSVTPQHSGNYTCIASNAAASANYTARLTVNVPPRWILEPHDSTARISDHVTLHCQAHGTPSPYVIWKKAVGEVPGNYKPIADDGYHYHISDNGSLHIFNIAEADKGYYLCQVSNNIGGALSKVVLLNIHIAARFAVKFRNETVAKGSIANLVCEASGDAPISISWTINKQKLPLQGRPRYKIQERKVKNGLISELSIVESQREDSATLSCTAVNIYGVDETTIQLVVQEPPDSPMNVRIVGHNSRSVQLAWLPPYGGNSPIDKYIIQYKLTTETWNNHSKNITINGPQTTASISDLVPASSYHLRIVAVNNVGFSEPSDALTITSAEEAPSGHPRNVTVFAMDSRTLKVTWEPPHKSDWNGNILGYYVGYRLYDSSEPYVYHTVEARVPTTSSSASLSVAFANHQLQQQLTNLMKYTKYRVVVSAYNHLGSGPQSDEVLAITLEDVPEQPPLGIQCTSLSSQSLHVSWEPPPPQSINGYLRGYKVNYAPVDEEGYDDITTEVKITSSTKTILHGLSKYTNYSLQLLAFTRPGDGVLSDPIFCRTGEDVPLAPADIKAAVMSSSSIIVTWKAPLQPNGIVTKYTVYVRGADDHTEETTKYVVLPSKLNTFEATSLKSNRRYDFWVTASTTIGEGQSTRVVSQSTGNKVPARIVSLSDHLITPWEKELKLPCRTVGIPAPQLQWTFGSKQLQMKQNDRMRVLTDGTLTISAVTSNDNGNYTCTAQNAYGSDTTTYNVIVLAPPTVPSLYITAIYLNAIDLKWKANADKGPPIQGYHLNFKREYGEWEELVIDKKIDSYTLQNLWCGSRYQIFLNAFNKIGTGEPSPILTTKTKGFAPEVPPKHLLLHENTTFVTVHLDTWKSGGCPVLYFVIEYQPKQESEWMLVSNNVQPSQKKFVILDLKPQTWYNIRVTAHNSAGSTSVEYLFMTRTLSGGTVPPEMVRDEEETVFVIDFRVIVSLSASIFVVIASFALVCVCIRQQRTRERREKAEEVGNAPNNVKSYHLVTATTNANHIPGTAVHEKGSFTMLLGNTNDPKANRNYTQSATTDSIKKDIHDDVCPYATFPITPTQRESQCLTHIKPYNHRNSLSTYDSNHTSTYSKVQKRSNNTQINMSGLSRQRQKEDYHSESDLSELTTSPLVEPFMQMHDGRQHHANRLEQRVPDLLYHKPESSSTETSPDMDRRIYQRPGRTRSQTSSGKVIQSHPEVSEDSQDSNSEENVYAYEHTLDVAVLYSDGPEFSEAECDRDRRYKYIEELKSKHYDRNYRDGDNPTLLVRRFQENPDSGFYSERNVSEEYTIAV